MMGTNDSVTVKPETRLLGGPLYERAAFRVNGDTWEMTYNQYAAVCERVASTELRFLPEDHEAMAWLVDAVAGCDYDGEDSALGFYELVGKVARPPVQSDVAWVSGVPISLPLLDHALTSAIRVLRRPVEFGRCGLHGRDRGTRLVVRGPIEARSRRDPDPLRPIPGEYAIVVMAFDAFVPMAKCADKDRVKDMVRFRSHERNCGTCKAEFGLSAPYPCLRHPTADRAQERP